MKHCFWKGIIVGSVILLVGAGLLQASINRGVIQGTVFDAQKAVMPGVKVLVKNVETGIETKLTTNSVGFFLAPELVPGKYQVRFEATGFSVLEINDVIVKAGTTTNADGEMKIGQTSERVEVTAEPPLLENTPSNFSTGVSTRYMQDLPLQGRDIQTLVQLFPGVAQSSGPSGSVFGTNSQFGGFPDPLHMVGSSVSSNGGQAGANAWFLEGSLNSTVGAESTTVNPSPDAVQEFNLVQNNLAAEYGRTSGMVVNVVLKSGTNNLHGSLYGTNRNSVFSASNPFARRDAEGTPLLKPWSNWNNFGGTLGGPVYIPGVYDGRNRTFFFVSDEVSFLHAKQNKILTVPLASEKHGDFRGDPRFTDTCDVENNPSKCIYDPATTVGVPGSYNFTRQPFATPVIPASRIDPLAKYYLDSIPDPNFVDPLSTSGIYANNYIGMVGSSMTTHNLSVKVDHKLNNQNHLFVSWLFNPSYYTNFHYPWNGPTAPTNTGLSGANPYNTRNQLAVIGWTSTLSSTLVNEARFSYGRQSLLARPNLDSVTHTSEVQQKVKDLNFWLFSPGQEVPTISFYTGAGWNGENLDQSMSWGTVAYQNNSLGQQAYTATDSITKVWGRHTLKGGFSFRRNNLWGTMPAGYNIGFDGMITNNPQTWSGGSGLAQFLLGAAQQSAGSSAIQHSPWQTNDDYAAFVQDDIKVSRKFTINLGLRWDVYGWIRERHDMLANFDLTQKNPELNAMGKMYYPGSSGHPDRNLFPANKGSFGPRIGFAWSPFADNKTVIRGGYGLVYSNSLSAAFGQGNGGYNTPGSYITMWTPWDSADWWYLQGWTLSQGAPSLSFPDLDANKKSQNQFVGQATSVYGFIKGDKDPYVQQWNLSLQRELPGSIVVSAAYVGSHGLHLLRDEIRDLNRIPKADLNKYRWGMNDYTFEVDPSLDGLWGDCGRWYDPNKVVCSGWYALMAHPQWYSTQVTLSPDGYSRYNSAQLRVEKRYSDGLNFIGAYTYSKNIVSDGLGALVANSVGPTVLGNRGVGRIAYVPGAAGGGVADGSRHTGPEDLANMSRYVSLAPDDMTHVFNIAGIYELPFGKGKKWANTKWANAFLGGWKITQNWNFQTGIPMFFSAKCTGPYSTMTCRPNVVGDLSAGRSSKTKQQVQQQYYNPAALCAAFGCDVDLSYALYNNGRDFQNSVDSYWQVGNAGRPPSGRAPGFWNADMSLARDFRFSESRNLNFRWNVFNAFNHQNLGIPNSNYCLPPGPNGETDFVRQFGCAFGQITNVQTDPRGMEFSLRFQF